MWSAVVILAVWAWGGAVVLSLQPRGSRRVLFALALGPGVGLGALSVTVFLWCAAGLPRPTVVAIAGVAVVLWALLRLLAPVDLSRDVAMPAKPRWPWAVRALAGVLCAGSVIVALSGFYAFSARHPSGAWDGIAMWNARARFFFRGYDAFEASLRRVTPNSMPNRPLLLPGAVAGQAMVLGAEDEQIGSVTALAFTAGVGLLVFAFVRTETSLGPALAAVALTFAARPLVQWGPSQMADIPTAYFLLAAAGGLASWSDRWRGPAVHPVLVGLMLGMLVWLKDEGIVLAAILLFVAAVFAIRDGRHRDPSRLRRTLVALLLGAAPGVVAILVYQGFWTPTTASGVFTRGDWLGRLMSPARFRMPVVEIASMLFGWSWGRDTGWGWTWAFLQVSVLVTLWYRTTDSTRLLSWVTLFMLFTQGSWILIYVISPAPQAWQISSSLERVVTQIYPMIVAATIIALDDSRTFAPSRVPADTRTASA